jgi:hypothetical protein
MQKDKSQLGPIELAEEVMKVVGDAQVNTALTALRITRLLILHREDAAIDFTQDGSI